MKTLFYLLFTLVFSTCIPLENNLAEVVNSQIQSHPGYGAGDSVIGQQIPNLSGSERIFRMHYWVTQDHSFYELPGDTAWSNAHNYSYQEQLDIDGVIVSFQSATTQFYNRDSIPDTVGYFAMCYKDQTLGPPDTCWNGGYAVRHWAVRGGSLYDTLNLERHISNGMGGWILQRETLYFP